MSAKLIHNVFLTYQKARVSFVQSVSEFANQEANVVPLESAGVLDLLPALLDDTEPSIQHTAAIAVGRLANHNARMAEIIANRDILQKLIKFGSKQNKYLKKASMTALRAVCKHNENVAKRVIEAGGLEAVLECLNDFEVSVKEAAVLTIASLVRHNKDLANEVLSSGIAPLLVLCFQEPEGCLKQAVATALYEICKHAPVFAQDLVDAEAVLHLVKVAVSVEPQPKLLVRQTLLVLANIAKHSMNLAEVVVEAEVFPGCLMHLGHLDELVRRNAASLTREIVKHSEELALLVVNMGGLGPLIQLISTSSGGTRLPAIMAIGYIASHNEHLAYCIISSHGVEALTDVLDSGESEDHVLGAAAWALGKIGMHSPEHAKVMTQAGVFPKLLRMLQDPKSSHDLACKCRITLKDVLRKCMDMDALELIVDVPPDVFKHLVAQFSKILPNDAEARKRFVMSGGLKRILELECEPGSSLMEYVSIIQACYPEEIIRFYSPDYSKTLLDRVASYQPILPVGLPHTSETHRLGRDSDLSCSEEEPNKAQQCEEHADRGDSEQPQVNILKSPSAGKVSQHN